MAPVTVDLPSLAGVDGRALHRRLHAACGSRAAACGARPSDILRFGRAMLRGGELDGARVLSPAFVDLMTREVTVGGLGAREDVLRAEHYAIGWGKPRPGQPGVGGGVRSRRRDGHAPLDRPRARPRVPVPDRRLGARRRAPINAVQNAVYAALP